MNHYPKQLSIPNSGNLHAGFSEASAFKNHCDEPAKVKFLEFNDPDHQARGLTGWTQEYEQLSAGKFEGSISEIWLNGIQLIFESTNQVVHQAGTPWENSRTFLVPMRQEGISRFGSQTMNAGTPVTLGPGESMDFLTASQVETAAVTLSTATLTELSLITESHDLELSYSRCGRLEATAEGLEELRFAFRCILYAFRNHPSLFGHTGVLKTLRDNLIIKIFETLSPQPENDRRRRVQAHRHIVNKAREYALASTLEPVTIPDLCRAIGISRRNLQLCFNEQMGVSPAHYLKAIRLIRVRRELRDVFNDTVKVHDVACKWGFWHMSSFAASYKMMFGELPSETLLRRR